MGSERFNSYGALNLKRGSRLGLDSARSLVQKDSAANHFHSVGAVKLGGFNGNRVQVTDYYPICLMS